MAEYIKTIKHNNKMYHIFSVRHKIIGSWQITYYAKDANYCEFLPFAFAHLGRLIKEIKLQKE